MVSFSKMMNSSNSSMNKTKSSMNKRALSLFALGAGLSEGFLLGPVHSEEIIAEQMVADPINYAPKKSKKSLSQSATSVNFFDPNGTLDMRLGQCVNLRTIYANGEGGATSGAIPFFTQEYIRKHKITFQDPRTESHIKSSRDMKSESEVWSASLEIPFVPLAEVGYASGSISDKETTTKEHQSVKFHLGSYAMNNVFSIEHGNAGFSEEDVQMSFKTLGCTHYVKEVHTGASVRAEIEMQSKSETWSKEQAANIDATAGMYPFQAAMNAPKLGGELLEQVMAGEATLAERGITGLTKSVPFIENVADAMNWSNSPEIKGSWSDTRKKAISNISMSITTTTRGLENFSDSEVAVLEQENDEAWAVDVDDHEDDSDKPKNADEVKAIKEADEKCKDAWGISNLWNGCESHKDALKKVRANAVAKKELDRIAFSKSPVEVQNMAHKMAEVQEAQSKMALSAMYNKHTNLMYTLVPIQALANEYSSSSGMTSLLNDVVKMTDLDVTLAKEVGDVVKEISAFQRWLKAHGEFVQDDLTQQFNDCLLYIESRKSDLQIRAMEHVNPTREQAHKFISEVRASAVNFTYTGFQNFEKCFNIYEATVGKGATLARFHMNKVLAEKFDNFEKVVQKKFKEVDDELHHNWFRRSRSLYDFVTSNRSNVQKAADMILASITELRDPTNKIFSEEYENKIYEKISKVTEPDSEKDVTSHGTYTKRNSLYQIARDHLSDIRESILQLKNGSA